jgi:uncharacterized protein (DUF1778 family)
MAKQIDEVAPEEAEETASVTRKLVVDDAGWEKLNAALEAPSEPIPALVALFADPDL